MQNANILKSGVRRHFFHRGKRRSSSGVRRNGKGPRPLWEDNRSSLFSGASLRRQQVLTIFWFFLGQTRIPIYLITSSNRLLPEIYPFRPKFILVFILNSYHIQFLDPLEENWRRSYGQGEERKSWAREVRFRRGASCSIFPTTLIKVMTDQIPKFCLWSTTELLPEREKYFKWY